MNKEFQKTIPDQLLKKETSTFVLKNVLILIRI